MPEISLIITTHNRPQMLARAIESARKATRREVEVVVVDDASTDETARLCRSIPHITYVRAERNQRVAGARNLGILASRGEFLSFLDDDDVRLPGSLERQLTALASETRAGFVYGQAILCEQNGTLEEDCYPACCPQGDIFFRLLVQNFIPCGSVVFRRACLSRVGLLNDALAGIDDWDLWLRIAALYPVIALEQPVIGWRKSTPVSGQGTSHALEIVNSSTRQFRESWLALPRVAEVATSKRRECLHLFSENMASHLLWETWRAFAAGEVKTACRNMLGALRLHPAGTIRVAARRTSLRFFLTHAPGEWRALKARTGQLPNS
ncbi:MAG TPA: glycosyltransferase family 2 protein [Pyrinomonadaceae bacterium]|nr:glycosyltransferase family 2 protein [Pyrinomonadaceae bacterium]